MIKRNYKIILKCLLVIFWMGIIFKFSQDPAQVSNEKSGFVLQTLTSIGININNIFGKMANFIVRKIGHITEYFILCILLINALKEVLKINKVYILSMGITFLYACSDEFHQLFIPGRSGKFQDVVIDTFGALVAVFIYKIIKNKIIKLGRVLNK